MKKIFVRVEKDDMFPNTHMVTVQTEGYPKTHGFVDPLGDTVGLGGNIADVNKIAMEVYKETKKANPDAKVILKKGGKLT